MDRSNQGRNEGTNPAGVDFLTLDIATVAPGTRTDWLTQQLRNAISDGRLPLGTRLPATRVLATELGVSRGLVTEAYQRLAEDGCLSGRGRNGTVVVATPPTAPHSAPPEPEPERPPQHLFSRPTTSAVFEFLRAAPAHTDLTPGNCDLAAFPRTAWLRAERAVLSDLNPHDLGYADPRGHPRLRRAVTHWLARTRGIRTTPEEILIVSGVAQSLSLIAQILTRRGHTHIAVEDPGSLGARQHLHHWQLHTPPVAVDAHGIQPEQLRAHGATSVLLTPAHQFPTGVVLSGPRRRQLLAWAADGGLIVEDDYDAEHRYDRPPVPALHAALPHRVCYTGSVSKLLAPALRLGWLIAPPCYQAELVEAKRCSDLGSATLPQLTLARFLESGEMERQLRLLRRRHRRRRDAMLSAVRQHLPDAHIHGAAAGLHLTLTLTEDHIAEHGSDVDLATAALQHGVKVQPLSWHRQRPGPPGLVLGYAAAGTSAITEGLAVVGGLLSHPGRPR
ncbi:PLP-dependent aminotransferase family protein [Lipingzhangella sp. LS1_29]|uniref:PLP-dependent aminotransferase family protein n=1 Tax=Lipingzhangella rawalii TaxID=2055835 RepID=A0ABU2H1K0_9ACTN|nr:PLP-dependent aminotransferase family protein [Lipingzhangella rawalii]MDS1269174.1 PLP-dependent aminotransferase family protein [Lipingzhangella rawalii]